MNMMPSENDAVATAMMSQTTRSLVEANGRA